MTHNDLKEAYPTISKECHNALAVAVDKLQETPSRRIRWSLILTVMLCIMLLLAGAALAATQLGILQFGRLKAAAGDYSLPDVEQLVSVDLAEKTINGVTIKVKEAYFDGRVLELLYAVSASQKTAGDAAAAADALLSNAGIDLQTSHGYITIDGRRVSLRSMDFQAGNVPCEYEYLVDSDLQYDDPSTGETKMLHPEKVINIAITTTGNAADALSFSLPVPEENKWSLRLPPPAQVNECTLTFTDLHFSPINAYVEYAVQVPAAIVPKAEGDDNGLALFDLQDRFCSMGIESEKGESLGMGKAGGIRECRTLENGDLWILYYDEYTAVDRYPQTIYLSVDNVLIPISMEAARQE